VCAIAKTQAYYVVCVALAWMALCLLKSQDRSQYSDENNEGWLAFPLRNGLSIACVSLPPFASDEERQQKAKKSASKWLSLYTLAI
jgi:hypothetical protein